MHLDDHNVLISDDANLIKNEMNFQEKNKF